MSNRIVVRNVRLSYTHIWEPKSINGSDPKYSVALIIPKADVETLQVIEGAIRQAAQEGSHKFGWKPRQIANLKTPLRDGDAERDDEAYADSMFLNANSKTPPQVVDALVQPILDQTEVYSGCFANVSINFYPFSVNGNNGVACGLGNIQKVRDGEALSGAGVKAEDEFSEVPTGNVDDFLD